jgi:SAM-dependent methyltransferase
MVFFGWFFHRPIKAKRQPQAWARTPAFAATRPQRRYLDETSYPLPKDDGEKERLDFQHYALHLILGNHYLAPLPPGVRTIVDVGTGTGIWCQDMARLFPACLIVGLDLDPALFLKAPSERCLLRVGDVLSGLPLPDQFADFTHQRLLVLAVPDARWPEVIHELVRVTQMGGWLELVETDARVQAGGPATVQVFSWIEALRRARGLLGQQVLHLGDLLHQEGVEEQETQTIPVKIGAWGGRAGQMMARDILAAVSALKEPCAGLGVDPETFERGIADMTREWQQRQVFSNIYVTYGRRTG